MISPTVNPMTDPTDFRAILSLKIKRLRKGRSLTLADLAKASGLSISYLSQLEAGQKYPTPPRMARLASALGCSYDELTSTKLERDDKALHAFLNSPAVKDFPFELFGILSNDVIRLLTRSPAEVTALLRAIADFAQQFDIDSEHFFDAALRAYQESTGNYYAAIEEQAEELARRLSRSGLRPDVAGLRHWLTANGVREIDEGVLRNHGVLGKYASVFVDASQRLLLNPRLSDSYKVFLLARETGYRVLGLEAQARTEPRRKAVSFDQVRDDFHATYFADALLMPRGRVVADLRAWLRLRVWQPKALLALIEKYVVLPERFMHRVHHILPSQFGIGGHFREFTDAGGSFRLVKNVDFSPLPLPAGISISEHHCLRWLSTKLLSDFHAQGRSGTRSRERPLISAQYSQFTDTGERYFGVGLAARDPLDRSIVNSFVLGFNVDPKLTKVIQFANDPAIATQIVGTTCERCPLSHAACSDRVVPPMLRDRALALAEEDRAITLLERQPI